MFVADFLKAFARGIRETSEDVEVRAFAECDEHGATRFPDIAKR
jgi:hypothetical protein